MSKRRILTKKVIVTGGIAALGLAAAAFLYAKNNRPAPTPSPGSDQSPAQNQAAPATSTNSKAGDSKGTPGSSTSSTSKAATAPPRPNGQLSGSGTVYLDDTDPMYSPNLDQSCQTQNADSCSVIAVGPGGKTIAIGTVKVDSTGSADISWNAKTKGFTPGHWTINVYAVNQGTKSQPLAESLTVYSGTH